MVFVSRFFCVLLWGFYWGLLKVFFEEKGSVYCLGSLVNFDRKLSLFISLGVRVRVLFCFY